MGRNWEKKNQSIKAMDKLKYESPFLDGFYLSPQECPSKEPPAFHLTLFSFQEVKNPHLAVSVSGEGDNIRRKDQVDIDANSLSPPDSQFFLQGEIFFQQREESFDRLPLLVDLFESCCRSQKLHLLREAMMRTDIEGLSVFSLPAAAFEETVAFVPDEGTAEFHPFSSFLFSPVDQFFPRGTEDLSFRSNGQLREEGGVFRVSGIGSNKGLNLLFFRKGKIGQAIIGGIRESFFYRDFLQSALEKRLIEPAVISFSRSDFHRRGEREIRRNDRGMKFVPEEEGVLVFHAPASILVGGRFLIGMSFDRSGIYGEGSFFLPLASKSLANQSVQNLFESFLSDSFFKDSEGVMRRGFAVGESTQIAQTSVESQFSGKMSLGMGFSKGNQKQSLKEAHRVKSFSSHGSFWDQSSDEREIDGRENLFQRIILRDILGDDPIGKTELPFHDDGSFEEVKRNQYIRYLFKYQYFN